MENNKDICKAFNASKKIYIEGKQHKIKVGMRQVKLTDTVIEGKRINNGSINIYDTSGFFTESKVEIDIKKGLPRLRESWHKDDDNFDTLSSFTSKYSNEQLEDKSLKEFRFPIINMPKRAKKGKEITQMALAKKGIITPEMEYVAIRENQLIEESGLKTYITPEFVREEIASGRAV